MNKRPTLAEIEKLFECAVEQRTYREKRNIPSDYMAGVAAALGWVTGDYEEPPTEEE